MKRVVLLFLLASVGVYGQFPAPVVRNQYSTNTTGIIANAHDGALTVDNNVVLSSPSSANLNGIVYQGATPLFHTYWDTTTPGHSDGHNTFFGPNCGNLTLYSNPAYHVNSGSHNCGFGDLCLNSITYGYANSGFGYTALQYLTIGYANAGFGDDALRSVTIGSGNTACGISAGASIITNIQNTLIGQGCGFNLDSSYNTAVGGTALFANISGERNTVIGQAAGKNLLGTGNTMLGHNSFYNNTGDGNIGIGTYAGFYETGSDTFILDNKLRATEALGRSGALLYGKFNTTPASQELWLGGGGTVYVHDGEFRTMFGGSNQIYLKTGSTTNALIIGKDVSGANAFAINAEGDSWLNGGNLGIGTLSFNPVGKYVVSIGNASPSPDNHIGNGVIVWAEDVGGSSELMVWNEADQITQLSGGNLYDWAKIPTNDMVGIWTMTAGAFPYADTTTTLTNSIMSQSGTNISVDGGGSFTGPVTTTSSTTNGPSANEFVTAEWARSLIGGNGIVFYNSTNEIGGTAFENPTYSYVSTIPAPGSRTYASGVLTAGSYFGSVITTNYYQEITGPIMVSAYFTSTGGAASSQYRVHPEIYICYDTNALATIGDWESGPQTLIHGAVTNRYDFVIAVPRYVSTNTAGFRLVRRFKVDSQTGTDSIKLSLGTNTPSQISFTGPFSVGANWIASGTTNSILNGTALLNGNTQYKQSTPAADASGVTNFTANFNTAYYDLVLATNCNFWQSTNRPAANTNTINTVFRIVADGVNVIVTKNASWKAVGSTTYPFTITNGDWGIFSIQAFGSSETNVAISGQYAH